MHLIRCLCGAPEFRAGMVCCCDSAILSLCSGWRSTHPASPLLRPWQSLGRACWASEAVGRTSVAAAWAVRGSRLQLLPASLRRGPAVRLAWRPCSRMLTVMQRRDLMLRCTMRSLALHGGLLESAASGIAACAQIEASPAPAVDCQISQNEAMQAMQALSGGAANDSRDRWCKHMNCLRAAQWVHAHAGAELACAWAHVLARNLVYSALPLTLCEL
jgi:hypothetical protein